MCNVQLHATYNKQTRYSMEQSPMNQMSFDGALMIGSELLAPVLRVPSGQTLGGRCPGQHRQTPGNNQRAHCWGLDGSLPLCPESSP